IRMLRDVCPVLWPDEIRVLKRLADGHHPLKRSGIVPTISPAMPSLDPAKQNRVWQIQAGVWDKQACVCQIQAWVSEIQTRVWQIQAGVWEKQAWVSQIQAWVCQSQDCVRPKHVSIRLKIFSARLQQTGGLRRYTGRVGDWNRLPGAKSFGSS